MLYVHGGGFVGTFDCFDPPFLSKWAKQTGALIVGVDYALAPRYRYPVALDEVSAVYEALRDGTFGFRATNIIVVGQSAGGNLAAALCVRAALRGVPRMPEGLILAYPTLNLGHSNSPSRTLFLNDVLLPFQLLKALGNDYVPPSANACDDPCISPNFASDDILRRFPPTCIAAAGLDPLLDDAVDFNTRLRRLKIPGTFKVYRSLPHAFLSMGHFR